MRSFLRGLLLLLALCSACEPNEFRPCPSTHTDPTKQLYQEVVTELIEHGLMRAYLPDEDRAALAYRFRDAPYRETATRDDSLWVRYHLVLFQHRLYRDSARFKTFYLSTSRNGWYSHLDVLPTSFAVLQANSRSRLGAWLTAIAPQQEQAALEQLNTIQQRMPAADFELCTSTLLPAPPRSTYAGSA